MIEILCDGTICGIEAAESKYMSQVGYNDRFLWVRMVVTDDKPNKNGWRIPQEEFDNVIRTGRFMPIKIKFSSEGEEGHFGAYPIGVITHLMREEDKVKAIGAIWKEEYPEIAEYISKKVSSGDRVGISWELYSEERDVDGEDYVDLYNVVMTGVAIVKNPAYGDRTNIDRTSEDKRESEVWSRSYINNLPDCAFLYIEPGGKKDEEGKTTPRSLRHLPVKNHECKLDRSHLMNAKARLSQPSTGVSGGKRWLTEELRQKLLKKVDRLIEEINKEAEDMEDLEKKLSEAQEEIVNLKAQLDECAQARKALEEYKEKIEAEVERQKRLNDIKEKFAEAGLEKDDEYFDKNMDKLLSMSDEVLEYMIQELVAFKSSAKEEDKKESEEVPNFRNTGEDLVEAIRRMIREESL